MIFKKTIYLLLFFAGILAIQQSLPMENSVLADFQAQDYEQTRDLPAIEEIFKHDWNRLEASRPFDPTLAEQCFEAWPHGGTTIKFRKVLRHKDTTIGFATYYFQDDPENPGKKRGNFEVGGIAPEYRHKGIATHFLAQAIQDLKNMGAEHITLAVKKDNAIAQALYRKLGFEIAQEGKIGYRLIKKI